ncbi:MAG: hypothetical protein LQ340_001955 [Diploschistes diacapsis]|nr:MAG: hypothetical protein LQ340_001955 [Diploschistes diacapsis]
MDGDNTAKTFDAGANSATKGGVDFTDSIHEGAHQGQAAGDKTTGHGTSVFDKQGAIGKHFTEQGALGGTAQNVGGPFDKEGAIGKQFTTQGGIGGMAQKLADQNQQH